MTIVEQYTANHEQKNLVKTIKCANWQAYVGLTISHILQFVSNIPKPEIDFGQNIQICLEFVQVTHNGRKTIGQ